MKKFFAILAVAGFLTACNDGGTGEEVKADSTAAPAPATTTDSTAITPDSTAHAADTSKVAADSTKK